MFVGHAPAGYLLTHALEPHLPVRRQTLIWTGVCFALLPDLDLLYFYAIDARAHPHHSYWTHLPIFWAALFVPLWLSFARNSCAAALTLVAAANVFGHLVLDSIVGGIAWGYPISAAYYSLFEVPATRSWWVWNFVLHWTFLLEAGVVAAAASVARSRHRRSALSQGRRGVRAVNSRPHRLPLARFPHSEKTHDRQDL